jgi:hypothetical protein
MILLSVASIYSVQDTTVRKCFTKQHRGFGGWDGSGSIQWDHHHNACRFHSSPSTVKLPEAGIDIAPQPTPARNYNKQPLIIRTASASGFRIKYLRVTYPARRVYCSAKLLHIPTKMKHETFAQVSRKVQMNGFITCTSHKIFIKLIKSVMIPAGNVERTGENKPVTRCYPRLLEYQ